MKTSRLFISLLVFGLVVASLLLLSKQKSTQVSSENEQVAEVATQSQPDVTTNQTNSSYQEYSSGIIEANADKRRVLYFYANWCPTCRPADADFKANSASIPEDVVVIRINYNDSDTDSEERGLADKYQITYQHTFVQLDTSGNVIAKWNGGKLAELLKNIK